MAEAETEKQREKGLPPRKDSVPEGASPATAAGLGPRCYCEGFCSFPMSSHCDKGVQRLLPGCVGLRRTPGWELEGVGATEDYDPRRPLSLPSLWNDGPRQRSALEAHVALSVASSQLSLVGSFLSEPLE